VIIVQHKGHVLYCIATRYLAPATPRAQIRGNLFGHCHHGFGLGLNITVRKGSTKMKDTYCLTAFEAAEMVGIDFSEIVRIATSENDIAINVGGAWRVDLVALTQSLNQDGLRRAA
jgi:hypothetical protein